LSTVFITEAAVRQALKTVCGGLARSTDASNVEVSGLLLGREIGADLLITSAVAGDQVSTEFGSELDQNFMAAIAHSMVTGKLRDRIVGMFHSHPRIGIFMSQQDLRTLLNFHRLYPRFVMMVIDPLTRLRYQFFRYDIRTGSVRLLPALVIRPRRGGLLGR
jgi:proteasome lid subunit RPN8/RPN11